MPHDDVRAGTKPDTAPPNAPAPGTPAPSTTVPLPRRPPPESPAPARRSGQAGRPLLAWLVVLIPVAAELFLGGYQLARASLWRDEGYTREVAVRSTGQILALLRHQDAVHGLYYLAVHFAVIDAGGSSAAALRLPSLAASAAAAGLTAALGRRLAAAAGQPMPAATGLLAGLLFAGLPLTTWYAQDARPYAAATLAAVTATYLLARGVTGGRGWWAGYAAAIVILGLLNLAALLLVAAHGVSLLLMRSADSRPAARARLRAAARRQAAAIAGGTLALLPLVIFAARQNTQLNWIPRPSWKLAGALVTDLAGTKDLIPLALALALAGAAADIGRRHRVACPPAAITVPWLVLPPVTLLLVSLAWPAYVERYVVFCAPAGALLMAAGLAWLTRLARFTPAGRRWPALAALPAVALLAVLVAVLIPPQQHARTTAARMDDLRRLSAIVARGERPGDAVLYLPWNARVAGLAYPEPFRRLRDLALDRGPVATATLTGTPASPRLLARRLAAWQRPGRRVWVVRWRQPLPAAPSPLLRAELALVRDLRVVATWQVRSVILRLYTA